MSVQWFNHHIVVEMKKLTKMEQILEDELNNSYVEFAIKFPEAFRLSLTTDSCITCLQWKVFKVKQKLKQTHTTFVFVLLLLSFF